MDHAADETRLAELLPLSPPVYHVLLGLGRSRLHGYGIMQAFETLTGGDEQLLPGTLYATLARMVESGLLAEVAPPEEGGDARRRYYEATALGQGVAAAESARLRRLLAVADAQQLTAEQAT